MPESPTPPEPIVALTLRYLDGQLSESEVNALAESLRADPALVDRFVEVCFQEQIVADIGIAALHDDEDIDAEVSASVMLDIIRRDRDERLIEAAEAEKAKPPAEPYRLPAKPHESTASTRRVIVIPRWAVYGPIAAVLLIAASILFTQSQQQPATTNAPIVDTVPDSPAAPTPVARLVRAHDAVWAGPDGSPITLANGPLMANQQLNLLEGVAEVRMSDGALLYLQGTTTVRVTSASSIELDRGRLTAKVGGQAVGFQVLTPRTQVVDYGTEFGLVVDQAGQERAEVFTGRVTLAPIHAGAAAQSVTLNGGQGLAMSPTGETRSIAVKAIDYVRDQEFDALMLAQAGSAYHRWLAHTFKVQRDPSVVAFYVFNETDVQRNRLTNHAMSDQIAGDGFLGDGANISPPTWSEGRFEQTRALTFGIDPHGDCRGVLIPDSDALDFDREMTIAAWVRFDHASTAWNTLLSKRDIPPSNLNYQLSLSGQWYSGHCRFQFGAGRDDLNVAGFDETPATDPGNTDQWQHVAVVSDGTRFRYYINGELVSDRAQPMAPRVNSAPLLIGTSSPELRPPLQNGKRPLNGAVSELLLASRAMAGHEIQALYNAGRPEQ